MKIELTDEEWMSVINNNRDGLPVCCANISTLRDDLIDIARGDGYVNFLNPIKDHMSWCFPEHETTPVIRKVMEQLAWSPKDEADHVEQGMEL